MRSSIRLFSFLRSGPSALAICQIGLARLPAITSSTPLATEVT
nr:hypothetical protein [Citrifermentans bremense]